MHNGTVVWSMVVARCRRADIPRGCGQEVLALISRGRPLPSALKLSIETQRPISMLVRLLIVCPAASHHVDPPCLTWLAIVLLLAGIGHAV